MEKLGGGHCPAVGLYRLSEKKKRLGHRYPETGAHLSTRADHADVAALPPDTVADFGTHPVGGESPYAMIIRDTIQHRVLH